MMKEYYRLTLTLAPNKRRTFWCYKSGTVARQFQAYIVVDKGGDRLNEIVICAPEDIISIKPAKMNLKYAELELAP